MSNGYCNVQHGGYRTRAECEWPYACWITGSGRYACLAWCRVLTVTLWGSREDALAAKEFIDRTACGGGCHRDHRIVDLNWPHRKFVREGGVL